MKKKKVISETFIGLAETWVNLVVVVGSNERDIEKEIKKNFPNLKKKYIRQYSKGANAVRFRNHKNLLISINIYKDDKKDENIGIFAHEASHVSDFLADIVGFVYNYENQEQKAYIIGSVTQKIFNTYQELIKS